MKIINEKGKLFGIINVVDLITIVFIVAVIAGVIWKIGLNKISDAIASDMEIEFTVQVDGVDCDLLDSIEETLPAPMMSNGSYISAEVSSVEFLDYVSEVTDEDGITTFYPDETHCSVLFHCTAKVPEGSVNLPVGSQEIRIGKEHIVKTRNIEFEGYVTSLVIPK